MKKILLAIAVLLCAVGCKNTNGKAEVTDQATEVAAADFSGNWAEQTAERVVAVFTPSEQGYEVRIGWREDGLAQYEVWTMTAERAAGDTLVYTNGRYVIQTFEHQGDKDFKEEVKYENGTGKFFLNSDSCLVWVDEVQADENADNETVFIRTDLELKH